MRLPADGGIACCQTFSPVIFFTHVTTPVSAQRNIKSPASTGVGT